MTMMLSTLFLIVFGIHSIQGVCVQVIESGVVNDMNTVLQLHNSLRLSLTNGTSCGQPKACRMPRLQYDQQLAAAAQQCANKCEFGHSHRTDSRWGEVGQNIYMSYATDNRRGADWNAATQSWFNECRSYRYPNGFAESTGHYTQMVWADNLYIGCGYTLYRDNDNSFPYKKLYCCNYGPGGNIPGQAPYPTGQC